MTLKATKVLAFAGLAALASVAQGDIIGNAVTVTATNPNGTASWTLPSTAATWEDGRWTWSSDWGAGGYEMRLPGGELVGTMQSLTMGYVEDPQINLNFVFTAGVSSTNFTISSGLLTFATIDAEARASSGITLTDIDGTGATVAGLFGNRAYRANYNGSIPGPTQFATLIDPFGAPALGGNIGTGNTGAFSPIGFTSSMEASFSFTLSANDSSSGTSTYITRIIPTPGTLALLGLGGLAAARRRR